MGAGRTLQMLVKSTIGVSAEVAVLEPDEIERSLDKMRRILDQRPTAEIPPHRATFTVG